MVLEDSSKSRLRQGIKGRLAELLPEQFRQEGRKALHFLQESPFWSRYGTFLLFSSTAVEIDTFPLLESSLKTGKAVFVPRVESGAEGKNIRFYPVRDAAGPWEKGPFGIREPAPGPEILEPGDFPVLAITPGLAFDRKGGRLGHGGGFYDRFFACLDARGLEYTALGMCLDCQIAEKVPVEAWDRKMNGVLTGKGLTVF
jgi:5-formyltetrahydrofolate cyclo-ligase